MCAGCQLTSDDTGNNRVSDTIDFDSGQPNEGDDDSRFDTETGDDEAEAGTASINVSVATSGEDPDPDGYVVEVDSRMSEAVSANGSTAIKGVVAADHSIQLDELTGNCSVSGQNPRTVSTEPNQTTRVSFSVDCEALVQDLRPANYEKGTLKPGVAVYIDRDYTISAIPSPFEGWTSVRMANLSSPLR